MESITVLNFEIGIEFLIAFAVLEVFFTLLKTFLFDKQYARAGFLCFIFESTFGVLLTFVTCASLSNRTVSWKHYPLLASIALGIFEAAVVLLEASFVCMMTRKILNSNHQDCSNTPAEHVPKTDTLFIFKLGFICFLYPMIFLAIIILKRRTLEKSGDRPVEITTVISLFYTCLYISFVSAPTLIFGQVLVDRTTGRVLGLDCGNPPKADIYNDSDEETDEGGLCAVLSKYIDMYAELIHPYSPIKMCFMIGVLFSFVTLLTAAIQTFRRGKYIDSGIVTIFMVIGPGSFSVSAFSGKLIKLHQSLMINRPEHPIPSSSNF